MQLLLKTLVCVVLKMISFLFVFLLFNNHIFFRLFIPPVYAKFSLKNEKQNTKKTFDNYQQFSPLETTCRVSTHDTFQQLCRPMRIERFLGLGRLKV